MAIEEALWALVKKKESGNSGSGSGSDSGSSNQRIVDILITNTDDNGDNAVVSCEDSLEDLVDDFVNDRIKKFRITCVASNGETTGYCVTNQAQLFVSSLLVDGEAAMDWYQLAIDFYDSTNTPVIHRIIGDWYQSSGSEQWTVLGMGK